MSLSDFDYSLPDELIATHPAARRDQSRLLHLARRPPALAHRCFAELPSLLRPGDCLVVNDSRVIPARLLLQRPTGGRVEILLVTPARDGEWEALVRPARKLPAGTQLDLPEAAGRIAITAVTGERTRRVRIELASMDLDSFLARHGRLPLPPYIVHRRKVTGEDPDAGAEDAERYQTVYARAAGSIAAPTAGLHFTDELLTQLRARDIEIRRVTLHVGLGTFEPVTVDDPTRHVMHAETCRIAPEDAEAIEAARVDPDRRVVAVGTTAVRTLESVFAAHGCIAPAEMTTRLFIYPGYTFGVVDAMITNFHLPRSTLLMLVSAFAGREVILAAYREAVAHRYRFFSYGDAMLIE